MIALYFVIATMFAYGVLRLTGEKYDIQIPAIWIIVAIVALVRRVL